ncbi:MAG TPA: hypothetical protein VJO16_21830 [Candidatus Acidoferrum sp.]|nr:hypothetical protein [Candidatus Acidoferrum sp.]
MSVTIRLHGSGIVVEASDRMNLEDAVQITHTSQDHREFVKLAGTIRDPQTAHSPQYTLNFDRFLSASMQNTKQLKIVLPPGSRLRSLADFFCSPKTMKRVVNPILADMYNDYCQALAEGSQTKALWTRIRNCWSFWKALGFYVALRNLRIIWKIARLR